MNRILEEMSPRDVEELLFRALRALYRFERYEVARFGLTYELIFLLKVLKRRSPMTVTEISGEMGIPVFGATRLADQLEKRGLAGRKRGGGDRRVTLVSATKAGLAMVAEIERGAYEIISGNVGAMSDGEVRALLDSVAVLDRILAPRG